MRIYGLDFTSTPSRRKPLTCACCRLEGDRLQLERLLSWPDFAAMEAWLAQPGPWVAGCDFPFGLPGELTRSLDLPADWAGQVRAVAALSPAQWRELLAGFRAGRPSGHKEPPRHTDRRVGAQSAMKAVNPPVALMYRAGAPLLLAADLNILPCRPNASDRTALECYPALLARALIGRTPYKSDEPHRPEPARTDRRRALIAGLQARLPELLGLQLSLSPHHHRRLIADARGDLLDALLCAAQAAWAWRQADHGIPADADPLEGWIPWPIIIGMPPASKRAQ